jgi:hypothetical protein
MSDAAYFVGQQTAKNLRLKAQGFTGADCDLVDGTWVLWAAGRVVGVLEPDQADLALALRPLPAAAVPA